MEVIKIQGTATVNGNTITVFGDNGIFYNTLNKTKQPLSLNKEFLNSIPKGQKTFKVKFDTLQGKNINPWSLEIVPDEVQSIDTILKNIPKKRSDSKSFSKSTNLSSASTDCTTSSSEDSDTSSSIEIPPNAKLVTIEDILNRANEGIEIRIEKIKKEKETLCIACGKSEHSKEEPMSFTTWYYLNESGEKKGELSVRAIYRLEQLQAVLNSRPYCECDLKAIPRHPCNVFRRVSPQEKDTIDKAYEGKFANNLRANVFPQMQSDVLLIAKSSTSEKKSDKIVFFEVLSSINDKLRINHIVPRSAGGCPTKTFDIVADFKGEEVKPSNLIPIWNMCPLCQTLDELFTIWQNEQKHQAIHLFIANVINKEEKK